MAAMPPQVAPVQPIAPSPTVPTAAPPPPNPPPLSALTEKASQLAGTIQSQTQFEAALNSVGGGALPAEAKGQLWDTVQKTRRGQGLPPMTLAQQTATAAPLNGGEAPVSPATNAALPPSVSGRSAAPKPATPPPAAGTPPPAAAGLAQVPGQEVPVHQAPPQPTAQYKAPDLETAAYKPPTYQPPKKGLEYAAMALALLFPGAPIARAAAGFAQGLNQGAEQKYQRAETTAKDQYEAEKAKDATINQGRLATAAGNLTAAQQYDKWIATKTGVGNDNQDMIYTSRQNARKAGTDPNTGKPFILPPPLVKPPPPASGYDGLAQWHQQRALYYEQQGASGPAAEEAAAAKEAGTQAVNAANNARSLLEAAQHQRVEIALHQDSEANTNRRADVSNALRWSEHADTVYHEDQRALLADQGRRSEYSVRATAADKALFTTWTKATTAQTKTVENKDPTTGVVTGIRNVPLQTPRTDAQGNPVKDSAGNPIMDPVQAPLGDPKLQAILAQRVQEIRKATETDPVGLAQHYIEHLGSDPSGLVMGEILQQAGDAAQLRMLAAGRVPQTHAFASVVAPRVQAQPPAHPATRAVNGTTYYLHKDQKYYPAPEGAPAASNPPITAQMLGIGTP